MKRRTQPGYEYHSCDFMDDEVYIDMNLLRDYEDTGLTPEQITELKERDTAKPPMYEGDGYSDEEMVYDTWVCPNCGTKYEVDYDDYDFCPDCGQGLKQEE